MLLYLAARRRGRRCCAGSATATKRGACSTYGASLGGGCALGFLLFASYANRAPVCDALVAGLAVGDGRRRRDRGRARHAEPAGWPAPARARRPGRRRARRRLRPGLARIASAGSSGRRPELERLWLDKVREAMPIWRHGARTAALIADPAGRRADRLRADALDAIAATRTGSIPWLAIALPGRCSRPLLLLWQTRAGPAAQLLSIPGATALAWTAIVWIRARKRCWCGCSAWSARS